MTGSKLFFPQERIDSWMSQGIVDFDTRAIGPAGGGSPIEVEPAVLFVREDGGTGDPGGLLGKVKTDAQLKDMGADHYRDSVIVGDAAYGVVEGYVAPILAVPAVEGAKASAASTPQAHEPLLPVEPPADVTGAGKKPPKAEKAPMAEKAPKAETAQKADNAEKGQKDSKGGVDVDELARLLIEKL